MSLFVIVAGVPVPPTERQRLAARINMAASEALYRYQRPTEVRGYSPAACPGWNGSSGHVEPCTCGGKARHVIFHTNHPISPRVVSILEVRS